MNKNKEKLKEKIFGCLLGGAIGNAFGSPIENREYYEIEKKFGKIKDFLEPDRMLTEDDSHLILVACEAYLEKRERINSFDLAKKWVEVLNKGNVWYCCYNAYELLKKGYSPQITGSLNWDTGSALIAIAPVGIFNACDPDNAYIDAIEIGELYQRGVDIEVAALFAAAISEAFRYNASVDSIVDLILKKAPDKVIKTYGNLKEINIKKRLEQVLEIVSEHNDIFDAREDIYKYCLSGWHPVDPLELFILSIAVFYATKGNTELSIIAGTNMGRDADSIAGLVGALNGALNGISSIPKKLISAVRKDLFNKYDNISESFTGLIKNKLAKDGKSICNVKIVLGSNSNKSNNKNLDNKIFGALIGGIVGANSGVEYEGLAEIRKCNYSEKINELKVVENIEFFNNFNYTLDDGLAELVYEKLIEKGGRINSRELVEKWKTSLDVDKLKYYINDNFKIPAFYGIRNSLELVKKGVPEKLVGYLNPITSAAFHISVPIGIFNISNPYQAFYDTFEISGILEREEGRVLPALLSYIVASLGTEDYDFVDLLDKLIEDMDKLLLDFNFSLNVEITELKKIIRNMIDISKKYSNFIDARPKLFSDGIKNSFGKFVDDPLETFLWIISILTISNSKPIDAVISSINTFRDTTTIGFICGSLTGLINSINSFPNHLVGKIPPFRYKKAKKISEEMLKIIRNNYDFKDKQLREFSQIL